MDAFTMAISRSTMISWQPIAMNPDDLTGRLGDGQAQISHDFRLVIASQIYGLSENSVPLNPMVNDHYPY